MQQSTMNQLRINFKRIINSFCWKNQIKSFVPLSL